MDKPTPLSTSSSPVTTNPWQELRRFTDARIGVGRAGVSLPTQELLAFQLAHAQARDAVETALDFEQLSAELTAISQAKTSQPVLRLHSNATDRSTYLQRPDLGRTLNKESQQRLAELELADACDLAICVVDGLSSRAVQQHAKTLVAALLQQLEALTPKLTLAPICLVEQGRVAIGDSIGLALNAKAVLVIIGERPGLSSADSLGLYFTWSPKPGRVDAERNCISNIRPDGLPLALAAERFRLLFQQAQALGCSGVAIKDRSGTAAISSAAGNFLIRE